VKSFDSASDADVESYKDWMLEHKPIAESEARFLHEDSDLLRLARPRIIEKANPSAESFGQAAPVSQDLVKMVKTPSQSAPIDLQPFLVALTAAVIVPVLAFTVIPGFIGRMLMVIVVAGAAYINVSGAAPPSVGLMEWGMCGGMYVGIMAVIAGVAR
jgi:hypothetical protein